MARLLVVSSYFDTHRGGLEIVAGELARRLAGRGFEVSWLATDAVAPADTDELSAVAVSAWNVTERRLGIPFPLPGPGALARLLRAVRGADAVLMHDSLYPLSIAATIAAKLCGKPLLVIQHIGEVRYQNPLPRLLMAIANHCVARPVLAAADQVVFISHVVRDFFGTVRFAASPQIIFNGVDTDTFSPGDPAAARAGLGLASDAKVALFVGRFVEKKGLHILRAAAKARPDVTFAFAGWGHLDPAAWGLSNVRVFSGLAGASLADLYRAADVFVLPSHGEGFPLVVQEALACGLPVICGAETVRADPAAASCLIGIEVERDEAAQDLSAALDRAFASAGPNPARRALAQERYGWSAAADRYAALLRGLIEQRRPAPAGVALRAAS